MAVKKRATKQPPIDVKGLAAEIGATVKEGKIKAVRDKFFVTIGAKQQELVTGQFMDTPALKKLVGQTVPVIVSGRNIVSIGYPKRPGCYILCYLIASDLLKQVLPELRNNLIQQFVKAKVISEQMAQDMYTPIQLP